jgi:signal peptidase II
LGWIKHSKRGQWRTLPLKAFYYVTPVPGFLSLGYDQNTGMAWSLFSESTTFLVIVRILICLAVLVHLLPVANKLPKLHVVAWSFILSGAIGNVIDGVRFGYVVDMLQRHWRTAIYKPIFGASFPIFNLADMGVIGGLILLGLVHLVAPKPNIVVASS